MITSSRWPFSGQHTAAGAISVMAADRVGACNVCLLSGGKVLGASEGRFWVEGASHVHWVHAGSLWIQWCHAACAMDPHVLDQYFSPFIIRTHENYWNMVNI